MADAQKIKTYVEVKADFRIDGVMVPHCIVWEDGHCYYIDRVKGIRPSITLRSGGQDDRYTVMINGQQSFLFFERNTSLSGNNLGRWFVERRNAQ